MGVRIGCALPFAALATREELPDDVTVRAFGGVTPMLKACGDIFDTVELRMVRASNSAEDVEYVARLIHSYGMKITLHGTLSEAEDFLRPYALLLRSGLQDSYNITVHPAKSREETVRILTDICERIEDGALPMHITLENQRYKVPGLFGRCDEVRDVVESIGSPHLSICFDFGHQLSNEKNKYDDMPDGRFLALTKHTHIHSLCKGITHYPLSMGEVALDRNLTALIEGGFRGILSLELSANRYSELTNIAELFVESGHILRNALLQTEEKLKTRRFYRDEYPTVLERVRRELEAGERRIGLIGHAGYVLRLGNTRIAIDPAPCYVTDDERCIAEAREWLGSFDAIVVTHAHVDHFDKKFIFGLSDGARIILPEFIGERPKGATVVKGGDAISVGECVIEFFDSGHSRGEKIVDELGLCINYRGRRYLFPVDVRDYSFRLPNFADADAVFLHLWLGRRRALLPENSEYVGDFCGFAEQFSRERLYLGHLYDHRRTIDDMWTDVHVEAVRERLRDAVPFKFGEVAELP